jgi:hypothetical protein
VVAGGEAVHARPNLPHDPRAFVPADDRQVRGHRVAAGEVVVAMAQAGRHHLDQDLAL